MAHQTGFAGSVVAVSPAVSWYASVTHWKLHYETLTYDVRIMRGAAVESHPNRIQGQSDWFADLQFILSQSWVRADFECQLVQLQMLHKPATPDGYQGKGFIESFEIDDPLDGPVTGKARIRGTEITTAVSGGIFLLGD